MLRSRSAPFFFELLLHDAEATAVFMLQAFIDDSGNYRQGQTCLMAGCVASVANWDRFSERWHAALSEIPAIAYFKMSEAFALRREFKGWTADARDAKIDALIDVILGTGIVYGVAIAMVNLDYIRIAKGATDSHLNDPFYFLFASVIEACLIHQERYGIHEKVDFIFDDCNKPAKEIDRIFRQTLFTAPDKIKALNLVDNPPVFRDEKAFLPLQAADLIAGQIRSYQERGTETAALKKLGDSGFKVAYTIYDAKQFEALVQGTNAVQAYVRAAPSGQELARFMEIKSFVERLRGA